MSHRFNNVDIDSITVANHLELLPKSLCLQVEDFLPPHGSFDNGCLRRYLEVLRNYEEEDANSNMTLANRLRIAFKDMEPDTICGKFPNAELPLKRRLRCVAEYLIRSNEFDKLKDEKGKLVKKRGNLGKLVVIYKPLPKLLESLSKQGLIQNEPKGKIINIGDGSGAQ
jgi:hypothetical protein